MNDLGDRIKSLSPEQQAQLLKRLRQAAPRPAQAAIPRRASGSDPSPSASALSFAQQRLWFLDQLQPGSAAYNVPMVVRLEGTLDVAALERSFQALAARHETLRTTFRAEAGAPVQVIAAATEPSVPVSVESLETIPAEEREAHARRRAEELARRPFDLSAGPLLRVTLLRLAERDHLLVAVMHHIVSDGWSMGLLLREMALCYDALARGQAAPSLPPLPVQYADFATWQRDWLRGDVLEAQLAYWRKQLGGAPPALELPVDHPRPTVRTARGASQSVALPRALLDRLVALCREEDATLFMGLLAAFQLLLARHSGQDDVSVGSPVAGRSRSELEGLIGLFVNTVVLRARLHDSLTFRELLRQVRETTVGAFAHQDVPFERLVQELRPERSLGHAPLFQAMLVLQNAQSASVPLASGGGGGSPLTLHSVPVDTQTERFDLTLTVAEGEQGLVGALTYSTELFEPETAARLVEHLRVLVEGVVARPDARVAELPLLTEAERARLAAWNATSVPYPRGETIHGLFEAQAARTPDAVAATFEGTALTYRELDRRASALAARLRALGVGPEVRVGVCLERSLELVVALLGVLKAGGAYVPLDAAYPEKRLAGMLEDADVSVLLAQERLLPGLPSHRARVLCLEAGWGSDAPASTPDAGAVAGGNLAYVIFTSGSTGRPKGAMNVHAAVCNRLRWMQDAYGLTSADAVLQKTPFSFDVSVWEFFWPLCTGARLVLAKPGGHQEPAYLAKLIEAEGITTAHFVPSMLQVFLEQEPERCAGLRRIFCSGEALSLELKQRCLARLPAELHNLYGPTEAAVDVTAYACRRDDPRQVVPIGRPIANTQLRILDSRLQPVPIGVAGELYLGGVQVGRGYLGQPALTAERFVPDAHGDVPGARLYRTGDAARYLADGEVEYLGRLDTQVKVRGFRIELGEVESALLQHPGVREAAVVALPDALGGTRLVAYVVGTAETTELRATLKERLPEYMVPAVFVALDALPLSPNGKLDRRALPAPDGAHLSTAIAYVAPRTPTEELLAGLWEQLLRVERVGVHDDFFERGGHSLLATQVTARVRSTLGVELPVQALFEARTVEALAHRIDEAAQEKDAIRMPRPERVERDGPPPLSFAQQRLWVLHQLEPESPAYNMPSALQLDGALDVGALERSLDALVQRHEALRTTFSAEQGQPVQRISARAAFALERRDLQHLSVEAREPEARRLAVEEAQRPFDLARGPLLRACLLTLDAQRHVLLVTLHHIVADGWSIGVIVRELATLYGAHREGAPSPLPELPLQYADYAVWQRRWLSGETLEQHLAYWRTQLDGAPHALELATDRPRPPAQTFRGAQEPVHLPKPLAQALDGLCRQTGVTPFMLLLAAFQVLLHRHSGQDDVNIGSPVAGRPHSELEGLVGCFANTLVLRGRLGGDPTFRALLAQTRATALGAFAHAELPFEKLVDALQPARDPSRSPLFQAMLTLQNLPPPSGAAPGFSLSTLETEGRTAKFELHLILAAAPAGGWSGVLEYNTDLFDRGTAARLVRHLLVLLEGIAATPDARIGELPLLTPAERRQLLVDWNAAPGALPSQETLPALLAAQAARTPDAIAVRFEDTALTYRELRARAVALAQVLRAQGVGPDVRVGVCLERSHELVIALVAILEAGGAYLPLDPAYPRERLTFMATDSGARLLLTRRELADRVPVPGLATVLLDALPLETSSSPPAPRPDHLAYVLYTSGSTGQPKGVMVPHRTVSTLFGAMDARVARPKEGPGVWLAVTRASFDISVLELLWTLTRGFEVVVQPDITSWSGLAEQVTRHRVTHLQCTPSLAEALLLEPRSAEALRHLRQLLLAGEALLPELARKLLDRLPPDGLLNLYGPTETTMYSSGHAVRAADVEAGVIPLGTPIAHTTLYVLDARQRPVPSGVPGELYIGGAGVGRGYLGRPDLTAERFLPDPWSTDSGARLYRTGDRVRWRRDGTVEFLGRLDFQVKLRGFRIELGEIETLLERHPSVGRAVAAVREDVPGDRRLVAYVVAADRAVPDTEVLRGWLRDHLPEHMVPSAWAVLPALPLTPNGKVDRKALPAPSRPTAQREHVAPRTPAEETLAKVWSEVLGVERIGVHDNFFSLGGDSLGGLRMVAIAAQAGVSFQLKQLFQHQTLEALAVAATAGTGSTTSGPARAPSGPAEEEVLPLTPPQHWYVRNFDVEHDVWALNLLWEVPLALDLERLRTAVAYLTDQHDVLRLRLQRTDAGWIQRVLATAPPSVDLVDLSDRPLEALQPAMIEVVSRQQARLNIARGPTLAFTLCRLAEGMPDQLVLSIHHSIYDAYSLPLLCEDLIRVYQQLAAGEAPTPPEGTATYRELGRAIAAYGSSPAMDEARAFWLDDARLRAVPPLPVDLPGGQHTNFNTHSMGTPLPPELGQRMLRYLQTHPDVQLNDLLLYGVARAYARWTGGQALRIDVEHNGRTGQVPGVDLARTIGPTTLKFPLRFELEPTGAPATAFEEVRRTVRETLGHALGFGFLRYCGDDAARARVEAIGSPQVFFNNRRTPAGKKTEGGQGLGRLERAVLPRADGKPSLYTYDLMVECDGSGMELTITLTYSKAIHREETMRALADDLLAQIAALTAD